MLLWLYPRTSVNFSGNYQKVIRKGDRLMARFDLRRTLKQRMGYQNLLNHTAKS